MARIHILSEAVANKIAAGEVVERPASVVKELLENSLDAGSSRIILRVEGGGKKLIQITDNGCGMVHDDALLAFERHATSKIRSADDLLSIATLGFRGEALPAIASVSRFRLETRAADQPSGTIVEINGGKIFNVQEAGLPAGTSITVRDLFFNIPARKKFLKSESTELSHIASLVTHYALANAGIHFELHSTTHAILTAPPVSSEKDRVYQIFGSDILQQMMPIAAAQPLERMGLPQPPPWRRNPSPANDATVEGGNPPSNLFGEMRLHGFVSKPEIQKLNRSSIYVFANGRLIRDRLILHSLTEAYRNILPSSVFPVVLLFLEMPLEEVDVNVHPSKTEVRFRQPTVMHDFVRDTVRAALMSARPVPQFAREISAHPTATPSLSHAPLAAIRDSEPMPASSSNGARDFTLQAPDSPVTNQRFQFSGGIEVEANAALSLDRARSLIFTQSSCEAPPLEEAETSGDAPPSLSTLKPLGQIRDSFILAVDSEGLWIIDQHVAHERVLFERILRQRAASQVEGQRLLMPIVLELTPVQQAAFTDISGELNRNGFEAEPFGARSVAIKIAPSGLDASQIEPMLHELFDQFSRDEHEPNVDKWRGRIAASIACHAAIKVNMALEQNKMEWLLSELAKTECPMTCPHGRPVVLRYSVKDILKAFKRI